MKVKELIEKLKEFNQEDEVITEGCDCNGDVASVETSTDLDDKEVVYLRRSPEDY